MASIRDIGERIFKSPQAWGKLLIGGLLPLTIIGIPWVFGYFFLYAWQLRQGDAERDLELPGWQHWQRLYRIGLESFAIALVWWLLPLLVLSGFALLLRSISDLFWPVAYVIKMVAVLAGPAFYVSALACYQRRREWDALLDVNGIISPLLKFWPNLVVPGLVWLGLLTLALPLLSWAAFVGVLLWVALLAPILVAWERQNPPSPR